MVNADEILVLEKGKIAERGTHADLLAQGNVYARMWERQQEVRRAEETLAQSAEAGVTTGDPAAAE